MPFFQNLHQLNLQQWLTLLESRHPTEIELGLDRIKVVADILQCQHFDCPVTVVAGTNGKGSCVEMLKQLALSTSLTVGSYTSPHLLVFNERICINGTPVKDIVLTNAFVKVEEARLQSAYQGNVPSLSYFEFTTLAALLIFRDAKLDFLILEVGLGGRLDAVNIVDADVAIITSIGIDHEVWLGNTRSAIAQEKAGIARQGKFCVVGETNLPEGLLEALAQKGADLVLAGKDFDYQQQTSHCSLQLLTQEKQAIEVTLPTLPRLAIQNVAVAIQTFLLLNFTITEQQLDLALSKAALPGRCEIFEFPSGPLVICDLAHNPAGVVFFKKQLAYLFASGQLSFVRKKPRIAAITGIMADKDFAGMFAAFDDGEVEISHWYCCNLPLPRAATAKVLAETLRNKHVTGLVVSSDSPLEALQEALKGEFDVLLVFGSFYTLAPVYGFLCSLQKEQS